MSKLHTKINELKEELDKVTLREIINNKEILESLKELIQISTDFMQLINKKRLPFELKTERT